MTLILWPCLHPGQTSEKKWKIHFIRVSMYLARKYWLRTLFLRLQLETGPPFYLVIRATRRSSYLRCKGRFFTEYCSALRIEPATFRSAVKRSTDWANPAAIKDNYTFIIQNSSKLDIVRYWFTNFLKNYKRKSCKCLKTETCIIVAPCYLPAKFYAGA